MKKITASLLALAIITGVVAFAPNAFAQTPPTDTNTFTCSKPNDIGQLFALAICILGKFVVPFLFAVALVIFLVGIVKYIKNGDNEESRQAGRGLMIFGIIALFVMVAVWGLVRLIFASFFPADEFRMPSLPPQATRPFQSR